MGVPPPKPAPPWPRTPLVSAGHNEETQSSGIEGVPPGYVYLHTPFPNSQFSNLDTYGKDRMNDKDFILDLLTNKGTSTG